MPADPCRSRWLIELERNLELRDRRSLRRRLLPLPHGGPRIRVDGRTLLNLASNDYLGLSEHPQLKARVMQAAHRLGVGSGASRLVCGHLDLHARVEASFADFKHAEAACLFPTGYMANLAVLAALAAPGDMVCLDKLDHASLIDAARASGAAVRTFPHLNYRKLARLLDRHRADAEDDGGDRRPRRFIVTDSVFSMDGDTADLPVLCDLAARHDAILVVDEAHGTGVLGPTGAGLAEAQGVARRIDVTVSTASKAMGGLGGIVTAARTVIDTLVNHARPLIYTTAVPPAQAAAIGAAIEVIRDEPWRRDRLRALSLRVREHAAAAGFAQATAGTDGHVTPIIPLVVGTPEAALALAEHLRGQGFFAPAIRPPTVPPGSSRVRLSLRADLADGDIDRLCEAIRQWHPSAGTDRPGPAAV